MHVLPENAEPIHGIPIADAVTSANVQHFFTEAVRAGKLETRRAVVPLDSLIATQRVVDRVRVAKHERQLRETGQMNTGAELPLIVPWDGDNFIQGGHHHLQAAYNLHVPMVEVDLMVAPEA